jgi:hypothetical protein
MALVAILLTTACGPFLMIPGGALTGTQAPAPQDWGPVSGDVSTVQLETRPQDPYSVNIWAVGMGPNLYVHAGANRNTWVKNMEADSSVRIQIEEKVYDLQSSRVENEDEFAQFCDAYEKKFNLRPRNENVTEAYVFRLTAR